MSEKQRKYKIEEDAFEEPVYCVNCKQYDNSALRKRCLSFKIMSPEFKIKKKEAKIIKAINNNKAQD